MKDAAAKIMMVAGAILIVLALIEFLFPRLFSRIL
jgi:hypothetical protein